MAQGTLRLKRGREARAHAHPWIFAGDVAEIVGGGPGAVVTVLDAVGRFVGRGLHNPDPALCCRLLTWQDEPIDDAFLERRVAAALALRGAEGAPQALGRLVWSEADGLAGFVADRYGEVVVVQCLTLGMALRREPLVAALRKHLGRLPVFSADEAGPARHEGFAPVRGWLDAEGPASVVVTEGPARFRVAPGRGQKTGLYLDQRENRIRLGPLARDRDVLDAFCYAAGFACHALLGGARRALCIESSAEAATVARENLRLNEVAGRAEVLEANAFDELRRLERERRHFGLIVLDPPPFTRHRGALEAAARGYKEINLRAMRLLAPGGLLATFSCSHHVSAALFEEICRDAAVDARARLRVRATLAQASDHPVLLTAPETRYLTGLLLEATA